MKFHTASPLETQALGEKLAHKLKAGDIIAYEGGLGMGKTAFTRGLAKGLGDDSEVSSPTFALVHEYLGCTPTLYHFDMYRVHTMDDLYSTGFFDYLEGESILAVEWSENITDALPENTIFVRFKRISENEREITIDGLAGEL